MGPTFRKEKSSNCRISGEKHTLMWVERGKPEQESDFGSGSVLIWPCGSLALESCSGHTAIGRSRGLVLLHIYLQVILLFTLFTECQGRQGTSGEAGRKLRKTQPLQYQFSSVTQSCLALCHPMSCSTPGLPVHHQLPELTQTHVHQVGDAIQPSHPLSSPSPPASNPSQRQGLFQWVNSSHEVAKVLEFQLQLNFQSVLQSFQWTPRIDIL